MHPRQRQLSLYYNNQGTIAQDQELIDFCIQQQVQRLTLKGDPDLEYFADRLPNCKVVNTCFDSTFMLAYLLSNTGTVLERIVENLQYISVKYQPAWIYVAVNKYTVTTLKTWPNLTDDYDQDLLNIFANSLPDYFEIKRHSCLDQGQYFNFVHPTTYVYFKRS
jgi:hypothetical protein